MQGKKIKRKRSIKKQRFLNNLNDRAIKSIFGLKQLTKILKKKRHHENVSQSP